MCSGIVPRKSSASDVIKVRHFREVQAFLLGAPFKTAFRFKRPHAVSMLVFGHLQGQSKGAYA